MQPDAVLLKVLLKGEHDATHGSTLSSALSKPLKAEVINRSSKKAIYKLCKL
jgi:hypothetical protein